MGIRRVTVTGLLILTTTVALGCGAGAPKGSDDPLVDPVGADAATTPPDDGAGASVDGAGGAAAGGSALPSDDGTGGEDAGNDGGSGDGSGGDTGTDGGASAGPIGGTSGSGTIDEGAGSGTGGALPEGSPLPASGDDPGAELPGDPFGAAEATFRVGLATLTMGSTIHRLPRLASPGTYFHEFGSDVVWTSGDGWYLQVGGAKPNTDERALPAYIAIDWVHDGQHWVTWDPSGCQITIKEADKNGVSGTAKCKDMRWVDAIVAGLADEPTPVTGQPAFSVRIEFQAAP